ncbi:MAG: hypothetical protein QHC40_02025 [Sphingobium sp.]|nr:hypothetical protein [Sphingobium sp.]
MVIASGDPWRFSAFFMKANAALFTAGLRDIALEDLAFVIDGAPEIIISPLIFTSHRDASASGESLSCG